MSKRDLKALGASAVNTSKRLELRSGTTARTEEMETEQNDCEGTEVLERFQELEQKLEMAKQAACQREGQRDRVEECRNGGDAAANDDGASRSSRPGRKFKKMLERERVDAETVVTERLSVDR